MKKKYYNSELSCGVGILIVVQIVFIILKCIDVINWPWTTVLIPLWIQLSALAFVVLLWLLVIMFRMWRNK